MKRFSRSLAVALVAILAVALAVPALASEKPAFKTYPNIVDAAFVKEVVDGKVKGYIFDARPYKKKYVKGHIPGAVNLPTTYFDQKKNLLPADKSALVVFYCGGLKCALSHKAAFKAQAMGYKNVKVFAKGYPNWKKTYGAGAMGVAKAAAPKKAAKGSLKPGKEEGSVDLVYFQKTYKKSPQSIYLVDVRDPGEYKAGAIKGSVNIPVDKLAASIGKLPKDKPVVFVCGTGARSGEAYYMIKDLAPKMSDVYYIDGETTFNSDGTYKVGPPK